MVYHSDEPGALLSAWSAAHTEQSAATAEGYVLEYVHRHPGCTVQDVIRGARGDMHISRRQAEAAIRTVAGGRKPRIDGAAPDGSRMRGISRGLATLWPPGTSPVPDAPDTGTANVPRRDRAAALRQSGASLREIAAELDVSHPTVLRDLRAADRADAEAVLIALGADPPPQPRGPSTAEAARLRAEDATGKSTGLRWAIAQRMRGDGASIRVIAAAISESRSTVARHLADSRAPREWRSYQRRSR